jgi:hypothetical protein
MRIYLQSRSLSDIKNCTFTNVSYTNMICILLVCSIQNVKFNSNLPLLALPNTKHLVKPSNIVIILDIVHRLEFSQTADFGKGELVPSSDVRKESFLLSRAS